MATIVAQKPKAISPLEKEGRKEGRKEGLFHKILLSVKSPIEIYFKFRTTQIDIFSKDLFFSKEKSIFVNGVIMSYDILEKEIRQLPESYLEDVSKYIQFLLYQYEQERMSALEESEEVFNAKMQKGLDDARNGRVTPLDDAFAELKQRFA